MRGDVLQLRNREFIEAARVLGIPNRRIIFRHILPNVFSSFLVVASFQVAALIIAESSLSFLGLGVPNSIPTWGSMLSDGREYVRDAWWLSVFPGVAIMLAALSFNLIGDGLRDLLDPTLKASNGGNGGFARLLSFLRRPAIASDGEVKGGPNATHDLTIQLK